MKCKQIYILYSNLRKKTGIWFFSKKSLHKCLFKIPLWRKIDNVTAHFLISSKNLKALYLNFHWFNDSRTRKFELVTPGFEIVTRGFELVTSPFELVTTEFELVTSEFELVTRGFELVTRDFELVTRGFELVTRRFEFALLNFNSCF